MQTQTMTNDSQPIFWRDPQFPHIDLRYIADGHQVRYIPHSHEQWSIGVILKGQSSFLCGDRLHQVAQGDLVIMNAQEVHCCNPAPESAWSYYMMHIDCHWLAQRLFEAGIQDEAIWEPTLRDVIKDSALSEIMRNVCDLLLSDTSTNEKSVALKRWLTQLFEHIKQLPREFNERNAPPTLAKVAFYLIEHGDLDDPIDKVAARFGFSNSYLTRQFKRYYQTTPHAFRINRRIQLSQIALKNGVPIAEVANQFGFSDQAHFQRAFKERVAATPRQYRTTPCHH
ncbi:AraC family transcriptional regulator [Marinomonas gallaica]|uniref:AraC family transcriptional regulator n=1 Tax=Marinomonas gallaica TaxID=1806667 RepID=UPI003A8DDDBC